MSGTESTSTSADFQSATSDKVGIPSGEEDVFENSVLIEEVIEKPLSKSAYSSMSCSESSSSSKDNPENVWATIPRGSKNVCDCVTGLLYIERFESFINNEWPYDVKKGNLCHPRALALAGLAFHSLEPSPTAQCQVCLHKFENLHSNSNPWILHSETKPDCYIVKLGQRDEADDYSMDEIVEMAFIQITKRVEQTIGEKATALKKQLWDLKELCTNKLE